MTDNKPVARYGDRDIIGLGQLYVDHVSAMTTEGLHEKADIAAELAFRDARIAELRNLAETCLEIAEKSVRMAAELHERQIAVRQQADRLNSWITSKKAELLAMLEEGK